VLVPRSSILAVFLLAALTSSPASAAHVSGTCDPGIPADEVMGFRWFPRGDVLCPLVADPKTETSFASIVHGTSSSAFGTDIGSVGVSDGLGIFRVNGPSIGEGVQLGLLASVFAQFDLDAASYDLINADYVVGLPLTVRVDRFTARLRLYHQSSHLGDEYVLRPGVERENFAFESGEAILAFEVGPARVYGGGEYVFDRTPGDRVSRLAHGGLELRQPGGLARSGHLARVRLVAAVDVKSIQDFDWDLAWSARAGIEVGRAPAAEHRSRGWSLLAEYYDGRSPYGQFFRDQVSYYGVGLHLGP
jgi:Protein of unknown function (DUF1207)